MSASSSFSLMEPAEEPDANDVAIFDSAKEAAGGGDAGGQTIEQMYASTLGLEIDKARAKASIETAEAFWTAALADAHRVTSTPLLPSDGGMRSDGDAQGLEGIGRAGGQGCAAASHESEESVPKMHLLSYASGSHVGDRDAGVVAMGPYSPSPARSATTSSPSSSLASPRTPLSPPPPPPPTPQRQLLSKLTAEEDGAIAAAVESVVWQDDVRNRLMRRACGLDAEKQGVVFEHQRWTMLSGWRQTVPKSPSSSSSSLKTTTSASSAAAAARPKVPNGDPHPWAIGGRYRDEQQPHAALMEIAPSSSSTATTTTITTFPASMPTLTRIGPHETLWSAVVDQRFTDTSGWVYGTDWNRMLLLSEAALGGGNLGGKSGGGGAVGWLQRHATHRGISYREGGRAAARATDRVRRRMWLRHIEERDSQGVLAEPTASATGDERRAKGNDDNGQDDDRGKVTGDEEQADGMSASSALAPPSEVARAVLFDVLGRMARRRNLGFWSASTTLLDGTAWWRTVRRDVRDYAAWLRGPCGRINAALKLRAARQRLLMRRCWKGREGGSSSLGRGSDGTESPQVLEDISLGDTPSEGDLSSGNDDENDGGENNTEQNDDDDDDDELFDAIMAGTATSSHEAAAVNAESVESQARLEVLARAGECLVVPSSRLRLACAGALHACASYGYPMAKGWLSSVGAGATLLTWRRMTGVLNRVDAVRGVDGSSHDAAARAIVGQQFEILAANWTSSTFCPVWYVGADHALGWAVVSVRGTLNRTDIWTDLAVDAVPFSGGHVHRGVLEATNKVLTAIIKPLEAARLAYPSYRVVCCGHSLGGCIAAVLASMLRVTDVGRGAVCVAIGPMPCLSADVQVETAPPSQQMRSRAPRAMSESELVGREGINDNGGGDQTLKNKGDDEEDRNDDDDDYDDDEDDEDDDDDDDDDDEGDAAFSIERYMKASFGDGFDTRKANETLTTEAVAAAPPAPNVVRSEEEDSCSRGELENESGDSQDESGEVADDDSLDMKSQGDEEVFEACVGFEAFTTSVILGMDPAPRMSVACLERLLDDLARSTMASVTTAAFGSMGASVVGTLRGMSLPRIRGESNVGGDTRSMAGAPSNGNGDGELGVAAPTAESDTLRSVANDVHASAASDSNATREEPPEDPVLLPPGTLIHLDDDSQGLLSSPKTEKASTATRPMHSNDEREKKNAGSSGAKNTGSNTSGDAKRHVAAFYSDASHYRRLYLSFSLMSYHVPQRYLGALIAAVNEQRRLFPEGSKNPRSDDVTVAQFAVRFEHVGV